MSDVAPTDDEIRRVFVELLRYRLLPEPVREFLEGYLEGMDYEQR